MGEVYAGIDETLKRSVALKVVRPDRRLDAGAKARFLREAQILSHLDHPNICRVYNYVESEGQAWLVLELIEGQNLRMALDEGLTSAQRMTIATQIAQVLVVTHAAGIVHRDLKPGNVMITPSGDAKVLDFGLARSLDLRGKGRPDDAVPMPADPVADPAMEGADVAATYMPDSGDLPTETAPGRLETGRGELLGTIAYMSPEQARGASATAASDLYAFGLLLQEIFTGERPFDAADDSATLLERAQRAAVPAPRGLDADLTRLIQRLKSLAPAERPTAVDTLERLRWIATKPARRIRRLLVAAVVVVAASGVAKYSVDLRAERTAAVAARLDADRRRGQAEDLIGFMLGDLRKKLETVGRLEILDDVGAKSMEYFAAVPESALTDHELGDRSAALYQIGDVRIAQGRMAEASRPLTQSLALARKLVERHPDDGRRIFDLAQSEFWVGYVEWRQRHLTAALVHFREYVRLAERLVSLDGKNDDWRLELGSANSNIGSVLEEQGDFEGALERFRTTLAIETGLLQERPDDATLRRSAASSNNAMGSVLRALGRLDESLEHHRTELEMQEALVRREPGTAQWRQYLSVSLNRVAMLLEAKGDVAGAAKLADQALEVIQRLASEDPSNVDWQRELGRTHYRVGVIADGRGEVAAAGRHLDLAVAILSRAAARDALNPARQRDLADAVAARALHLLARRDLAQAARDARAALQAADRLLESAGDDLQATRLRGLALVLLGQASTQQGDRAGASAFFPQAAAALAGVAPTSRDYAVLEPWALALAGCGRHEEARAVVARLSAIGYRNPLYVAAVTRAGLMVSSRVPLNPR
jgi:eukaryotic-like serine/threonine-protein kinase